jgi:hypothetical protein
MTKQKNKLECLPKLCLLSGRLNKNFNAGLDPTLVEHFNTAANKNGIKLKKNSELFASVNDHTQLKNV